MTPVGLVGGVLPVIATPYDDGWRVDTDQIATEVDWLYGQGADGVVVAMVSEVLRLATDEREQLGRVVCETNQGRGPTVLSVGAESTAVAVRLAEHAANVGASAVMATPPTTLSTNDTGISGYYQAIIDSTELAVIIQDASGYVGRPLPLTVQASLFDRYGPDRVLFKPEALPTGPRLTQLNALTGGHAQIFDGSGGLSLVDSFHRGIAGTMPGPDLVWAIAALWNALRAGDEDTSYEIGDALAPLLSTLHSIDDYVAVEKHLLVKQRVLNDARMRGPHGQELDAGNIGEVDRLFERLCTVVHKIHERGESVA